MIPRRLALLTVTLASLAAPGAADAGELSRDGTVVVFRDAGASTANDVTLVSSEDATEHFIVDDGELQAITDTDSDSGCTDESGDLGLLWRCTDITGFRVETGGGNDGVHGDGDQPLLLPLTADGGPGSDFIVGGTADDTLDGGFGQDTINGFSGTDLVSYANRTEPVTVQLGPPDLQDGSANDGAPGARDFIAVDVEGAIGGSGDDALTAGTAATILRGGPGGDGLVGTSGVDTLDGGAGADSLNPLGGADTVLAGAGVDSVETRDGAVDTVDCGPDGDHALADPGDLLTSCEPPAAASPTPPTVITNTVIVPGPSRVFLDLSYTFAATRRGTTLRNFAADVERGARLTVSCRSKGKRCTRTRDLARATAAASVRLRGFEGKRLPVGAKLTIQATRSSAIGVVKTLTMRRRGAPSVRTLCLPPGATRPSAC